jgi:hypothetical protein
MSWLVQLVRLFVHAGADGPADEEAAPPPPDEVPVPIEGGDADEEVSPARLSDPMLMTIRRVSHCGRHLSMDILDLWPE